MQLARLATSTDIEFRPIEPPFSNFDFIDDNFPDVPPLRRLLSQIRTHGGRTLVIEKLIATQDVQEENEDIDKRYPGASHSQPVRLSFFTKPIGSAVELTSATDSDFLGYVIIKNDHAPAVGHRNRIYESVLRMARHDNNFVHSPPTWECEVAGHRFRIQGYLYAQQNNMTNCCAHVAVRTAVASFSSTGDMTYRQMNDLLGIDHVRRKIGGPDGGGLDVQEMRKVLETVGARCFVADYQDATGVEPPAPFHKYIYGSIESGFPAIVIFDSGPDAQHAIPVFGHTFNEDTWVPSADRAYFRIGAGTAYIPSESWLSTFIAHDDNWGSNFCIPTRYLHTRRMCNSLPGGPQRCVADTGCVSHVIATFPQGVTLNAVRAEAIGADYLFTILGQLPAYTGRWAARLMRYAAENQLVLRPVLTNFGSYVAHLAKIRDWEGRSVDEKVVSALRALPDIRVWMVELSIPNLFPANKRKVGEVLILAEREVETERDFESFMLARLPGCFALYNGGGAAAPSYVFIQSGASSHVDLYGVQSSRRRRQ